MEANVVSVLEWLGQLCLNTAGEIRCLQAVANRQGIQVPIEKVREVTSGNRLRIARARAAVDKEIWLRPGGARDALCIELQLTTDQVAGVLASLTKERNGGSDQGGGSGEPEPINVEPPAEPGQLTITADPKTWPLRQLEPGAKDRKELPAKNGVGQYPYEHDDLDWEILKAVFGAITAGDTKWKPARDVFIRRRRLGMMQVAGMTTSLGGIPRVGQRST